ncbi:MAG: hypothetical protein KGL39_60675 [Patescibacteria group bacterium]|nr:hypothetical protein [Patescibacteria group bacterium]
MFKPIKAPAASVAMIIAAALCGALAATVHSAEPKSDAPPVTAPDVSSTNAAAASASAPKPEKHQLTGAELYSIHCNRCHPERYPTERTAAQWKTIMLHMQVRANIPGNQARLILQYLQENSGR